SRELEPEWTAVQNLSNNPNIVSFDCETNPRLCRELDVASYPAIRLYHRNGHMNRYRGERKGNQIHAFLRRAQQPPMLKVDVASVSSFLDIDHVIFIAHIRLGDDSLRDRFNALANKYRNLYSFIMTGPLQDQSALHCINNIDEEEHTATNLGTVGALEDFIKQCSSPLIPELTRKNEVEYTRSGKSLLHYFFGSEEEKEEYRTEMRSLAKKYAEFLHFTLTDVHKYPEMLRVLGLKAGSKTGLSLQNPNTGDVFPYLRRRKMTAELVEQFLIDVISGKVEPLSTKPNGHDEL
ncbi:thioredoxin-like domain-containing protein, partial [Lasiosphaeria hispida]